VNIWSWATITCVGLLFVKIWLLLCSEVDYSDANTFECSRETFLIGLICLYFLVYQLVPEKIEEFKEALSDCFLRTRHLTIILPLYQKI